MLLGISNAFKCLSFNNNKQQNMAIPSLINGTEAKRKLESCFFCLAVGRFKSFHLQEHAMHLRRRDSLSYGKGGPLQSVAVMTALRA